MDAAERPEPVGSIDQGTDCASCGSIGGVRQLLEGVEPQAPGRPGDQDARRAGVFLEAGGRLTRPGRYSRTYRAAAIVKLGEVCVSSGLDRLLTRILARELTAPTPVQS